jgi:hypothetical protein
VGKGTLSAKLFSIAVLWCCSQRKSNPKFEALAKHPRRMNPKQYLNPKRFGHLIIHALSLFRD